MSDEELERKYATRLEKERTENDVLLKQILLEKQTKLNEMYKEIQVLQEKLNEHNSNYINKLDHEIAIRLLKDEINEVVKKNKELERGKKYNIIDKNLIFVLKII
jgi:hypothetical protein